MEKGKPTKSNVDFYLLFFYSFFYRITVDLGNIIEPTLGYLFGKIILFTILPLIIILYIEKCKIKKALTELGVRKDKLVKSIFLVIGSLIITVILGLIIYSLRQTEPASAYWNTVMFLEAFNEEFLSRGVLLIYLWKITELKVAYATSILAFILAYPQHLTSLSLICVATQEILLGVVAHKTKNIIGPWISHGLNRSIPQLLMSTVFQLL